MYNTPTELLAETTIQPEESKYRGEVDEIKKRSNDILNRIAEFEKNHAERKKQMQLEAEEREREMEMRKFRGPLTPRTYESYHEEELDLEAQLKKLKNKNKKLQNRIEDMKKMLAESEAKEKELKDELDFTYQKRLLLDKRSLLL